MNCKDMPEIKLLSKLPSTTVQSVRLLRGSLVRFLVDAIESRMLHYITLKSIIHATVLLVLQENNLLVILNQKITCVEQNINSTKKMVL